MGALMRWRVLCLLVAVWTWSNISQLAVSIALPAYLVIGQQKCGTSTLWSLMKSHPQLATGSMGGDIKEQRFFQSLHVYTYGEMADRCDRNPDKYMALWPDLRDHEFAGDFTPAHLSCYCCPELFHKMIPKAKIIAILRDPVSRAQSRFIEQYNWPFPVQGILTKIVRKFDHFGDFATAELMEIRKCLESMTNVPAGGAGNKTAVKELIEYRCLAKSNTIGWSAYSIYLRRWLEFFPQNQLLVVYTSDLETNPKKTIRKIEKFLGLKAHTYDNDLLHTKFNTKDRYGWKAGVIGTSSEASSQHDTHSEASSQHDESYADIPEGDEDTDSRAKKIKFTGTSHPKYQGPKKSSEELKGDVSEAIAFLKPYMLQLKSMADDGIIAEVPDVIMAPYV